MIRKIDPAFKFLVDSMLKLHHTNQKEEIEEIQQILDEENYDEDYEDNYEKFYKREGKESI